MRTKKIASFGDDSSSSAMIEGLVLDEEGGDYLMRKVKE